jgi:hypothetical protein
MNRNLSHFAKNTAASAFLISASFCALAQSLPSIGPAPGSGSPIGPPPNASIGKPPVPFVAPAASTGAVVDTAERSSADKSKRLPSKSAERSDTPWTPAGNSTFEHPSEKSSFPSFVSPNDQRSHTFPFDPSAFYTIATQPLVHTRIEIEADDEILEGGIALGDTARWMIGPGQRSIVVKPLGYNLTTTLTIETRKRTYDLMLTSGPVGSMWYRKVQWSYPLEFAAARAKQAQRVAVQAQQRAKEDAEVVRPNIDRSKLNFDYVISGNASFAPLVAFDDGEVVVLRMAANAPIPAVFIRER